MRDNEDKKGCTGLIFTGVIILGLCVIILIYDTENALKTLGGIIGGICIIGLYISHFNRPQ